MFVESPLWQAILSARRADEDAAGAARVYADWLQTRGDPHGQVIALSCALTEARAALHEAAPHESESLIRAERELATQLQSAAEAVEEALYGCSLTAVDGLTHHLLHGVLGRLLLDVPGVPAAQVAGVLARPAAALLNNCWIWKKQRDTPLAGYLEALGGCEFLRSLGVDEHDFSERDARALAALTGLRELTLSACRMPTAAPAAGWLGELRELRELRLTGEHVAAATTALLPSLERLTSLDVAVHGESNLATFEHVVALPPLASLDLTVWDTGRTDLMALESDAAMASLAAHESLMLDFHRAELAPALLRRLAGLESLHSLALWSSDFSSAHARALQPAQSLHTLSLDFLEPIGDLTLRDLPELSALVSLSLCGNEWLTGDALQYLERVPGLLELEIDECEGADRELIARIAGCHKLHTLTIQEVRGLQPGDLEGLRGLSELRSLDLSWLSGPGARDLQIVTDMPELRSLYLYDMPLDEAALDVIVGLRRLESLHIRAKAVPEHWFRKLTELEHLRYLVLDWKALSATTLAELRAGLPACTIPEATETNG